MNACEEYLERLRAALMRSVPEAARQPLLEIAWAWHGAVVFAQERCGHSAALRLMCAGIGLHRAVGDAVDAIHAAPTRPAGACA